MYIPTLSDNFLGKKIIERFYYLPHYILVILIKDPFIQYFYNLIYSEMIKVIILKLQEIAY